MAHKSACDLLGPPLRILLLSPQPWAGLQVSKHHYARELAALGHRVFFVNPPGGAPTIGLTETDEPGIVVVDHPPMPLWRTKFRLRRLFDLAARRRASAIVAATGAIDLLWDFDNARQFSDYAAFGAAHTILHAVDRLEEGDSRPARADLTVTIDPSLIPTGTWLPGPALVLGHGLSPLFAASARARLALPRSRALCPRVTVGFLGNLAQSAIDHEMVLALMAHRRDVLFRFVGPVQGNTPAVDAWVDRLRAQPNGELLGLRTGQALIEATADIDIWLLCYDSRRDWNHGVNSHKLLEYFATGAEVVSSYIEAQADAPGVFMAGRDAPTELADLLDQAITAVLQGHDTGWQARIQRALASSYAGNMQLIAQRFSAI